MAQPQPRHRTGGVDTIVGNRRYGGKRVPKMARVVIFFLVLAAAGAAVADGMRFGVLSIAPPARIHAKWQPFIKYVSERLGQPLSIVVPRGFGKMKQAVAAGEVDFFYVNSHVFYRLKQAGQAFGVAQMQNIAGKITSRSEIFVRSDSGIRDLAQLKGKRIAFVSPMGAGGYLAPRAFLYKGGIHTAQDSTEVFTKNLSTSIHKVLLKDLDAATMCGVNYRLMSRKIDTGELRVIGISDEYPENLIAARSDLDPGLVARFRGIVIHMTETPEGERVLDQMRAMKVRRFLPYDPAAESITHKLLEQAELKP